MKQKWLITCGNFFFRYRDTLFPLFILFAVFLLKPTLPMGSAAANNITDLIGVVITLTGQFLRIFTIGFKYIKRGGKNKKVYADSLVVDGVFAHCRNPMYVGNIMIFLGAAVIINSPLLYVIGIPLVGFVYGSIIAAEEKFLHDKFGAAYDIYRAKVPRLMPNLHGLRESLSGYTFQWRRVLVKEFVTFSVTLAGLIGLRIWTLYKIFGAGALPEIWAWMWAIPVIAAFFLTIFALKKSHRLTDGSA